MAQTEGVMQYFGDARTMNDHHEQQQQWSTGIWSLEEKLCATKNRAGEVTQALGGAQKIVSWIADIGQLEFNFCFWLWLCTDIFPSLRKKLFLWIPQLRDFLF
jgi:hypothetical protein